jgi:hypothetical protein
MTFFFLLAIIGCTDTHAPRGLAPIAHGQGAHRRERSNQDTIIAMAGSLGRAAIRPLRLK